MREIIAPEDRKGIYYDEIRAEDLIIMGRKPDNIAGCISLDEGILAGLWRLSVETGLGLTVDVRRVPLPQTYIDKCNRENTIKRLCKIDFIPLTGGNNKKTNGGFIIFIVF